MEPRTMTVLGPLEQLTRAVHSTPSSNRSPSGVVLKWRSDGAHNESFHHYDAGFDRGGRMDSRFLMTLQVAVVGAQKIGAVPHGTRVTAPIASGQFEGP